MITLGALHRSQCTYRCVVLPDNGRPSSRDRRSDGLNAPTGAWCSLTYGLSNEDSYPLCLNAPTGAWCSLTCQLAKLEPVDGESQCTYRCVVLPDISTAKLSPSRTSSQCTYRCVVLPDSSHNVHAITHYPSQCTYRCVVLPDCALVVIREVKIPVSMHLQVRGAP